MQSENGEPLHVTDSDTGNKETAEPQALAGEGKEEDPGQGACPPSPADGTLAVMGQTFPKGDKQKKLSEPAVTNIFLDNMDFVEEQKNDSTLG